MKIYCCECKKYIESKLVTGDIIYPHRKDLYKKKLHMCPICGNYVGCHPNTNTPLGSIPNAIIRQYRMNVHNILDPLWKNGLINRSKLYKQLSKILGYTYHTGNINSYEEYSIIIQSIRNIKSTIENKVL